MIIQKENSNILEVNGGIICHQVNCLGVMGRGLALQIKLLHKGLFKEYRKTCNEYLNKKRELLGKVLFFNVSRRLMVANCFAQLGVLQNNKDVATLYNKLEECFVKVLNRSIEMKRNVHVPYYIGCGHGGGDWNIVYPIIEKVFSGDDIKCYIHSLPGSIPGLMNKPKITRSV